MCQTLYCELSFFGTVRSTCGFYPTLSEFASPQGTMLSLPTEDYL